MCVCDYSIVLFLLDTVSLILCFFVAIVLSFGGRLTIHLASFCFTKSPAISTALILSLSLIPVTMNICPPAVAFVEDIVEFICGNLNATPFCLVCFIHLCVAGNADSRIGILMAYWDVITYVQLCIRTVFLLWIGLLIVDCIERLWSAFRSEDVAVGLGV